MDGNTPDRILDRLNALYPKAIDLSLERVERLLADLGAPQDHLPPVVHVARPKSRIFALPLGVTMMLSGLMSR